MTSQHDELSPPGELQPTGAGYPADAAARSTDKWDDPELIVVTGHELRPDAADELDAADEDDPVGTELPDDEAALGDAPDAQLPSEAVLGQPGSQAEEDPAEMGATTPDTGTMAPAVNSDGMSQQWHDIQAMFVDDPQASVERAAEAADTAVNALVESLRERRAAIVPSAPGDTEQLRAALRSYRVFCQAVDGFSGQLPPADVVAH